MAPIRHVAYEDVYEHLRKQYGILVSRCDPALSGLDNSVFLIYDSHVTQPRYVFKIIETRSAAQVLDGIRISSSLDKFTCIEYVRTVTGEITATFSGSLAFVMGYLAGDKVNIKGPQDVHKVARFLSGFHGICHAQSMRDSSREATELLDMISSYWTEQVQRQVSYFFPLRGRFYEEALSLLMHDRRSFEEQMARWPSLYGMTHGDVNVDNILDCPRTGLQLIDFDASSENGFQLYDLLQFAARSEVCFDRSMMDLFLKEYFELRDPQLFASTSPESLLASFEVWLLAFSLCAMLTTDYYIFEINKVDAFWSQKHATSTLLQLQKCWSLACLRLNLCAPEKLWFTRPCKTIIAITGATTSGKSTLAAALCAGFSGSHILPLLTTSLTRSDGNPRFISCIGNPEFARTRFWVKSGPRGIPLADVEEFCSGLSDVAICICGPFQIMQLQQACPSNVKLLRVLVRYTADISTERIALENNITRHFSGERRGVRLAMALEHSARFFFDTDFVSKHVDVVLHRNMRVDEWTEVIAKYIRLSQMPTDTSPAGVAPTP